MAARAAMVVTELVIWMNGLRVGTWQSSARDSILEYDPTWVSSPVGRAISMSLPFLPGNPRHRGAAVTNYFENLLPDNDAIRRRIAERFGTGRRSAMDLLAAIGRDCVGAIQLLPPGQVPHGIHSIEGDFLNERDVAMRIRGVTSQSRMNLADDDFRISIAGAQEKTGLLFHDGRWMQPHGATPTNRILKLPLGLVGNMQADMATSVENEWLCSKIAFHFGMPVAPCDIEWFEDQKGLSVHRFDRRYSENGRWIQRLPQEDFCQVFGRSPSQKYQADGGPEILEIMEVLRGSSVSKVDRETFFKAQILFWLLKATDGHAKNFSVFLSARGAFRMTPLYDILSLHPLIGSRAGQLPPQKAKLAMAIRGKSNHYAIDRILRRHWIEMGAAVGMERDHVISMIDAMASDTERVVSAVAAELPLDFPAAVADPIFDGIRVQAKKLVEYS